MTSCIVKVTFLAALVATSPRISLPPSAVRANAQQGPVLSRRVESFNVDRLAMVDALLQLGQQEDLPLGIEYIDLESISKPISLEVHNETVEEVLARILRKGYHWDVQGPVLHITHEGVSPADKNLLDRPIADYPLPRTTVLFASHFLYMTLLAELHPDEGTAGDFNPGDEGNLIGPLHLRNVPVRQILNRIVSEGEQRKAAWIVWALCGHLDQLPNGGLWDVVEYETSPRRYADVLRVTLYWRNHPPKPPTPH